MRHLALAFLLAVLVPAASKPQVPITEIGRSEILSAGPEWEENYNNFDPGPGRIERLNELVGEGLEISVYLGLWCPDSRNHVPAFLKILDGLRTPVPVRYYSVRKKPAQSIRFYCEKDGVERVPTFIFSRNGKEIGRIVENPKDGLAEDMAGILSRVSR